MLPTVAQFLRQSLSQPADEPLADGGASSSDWDAAQRPSTPADWSQPVQPASNPPVSDPQTYPEPASLDAGQWLAEDSVSVAPGQVAAYPGEPDYAGPAPARPMAPPPSPYQPEQTASMEPRADRFETQEPTVTQNVVSGLADATRAGASAYVDAATTLAPPETPSLGDPVTRQAIYMTQQAVNAFGDTAGRRVGKALGLTDDEIANIAGISVSGLDAAGFAGQIAADPTNYVPTGAPRAAARAGLRAGQTPIREAAEGAANRARGVVDDATRALRSGADARLPRGEVSLGSGVVADGAPVNGAIPLEADAELLRGYGARRAGQVHRDGVPLPDEDMSGGVFATDDADNALRYADRGGEESGVLPFVVRRGARVADISDPAVGKRLLEAMRDRGDKYDIYDLNDLDNPAWVDTVAREWSETAGEKGGFVNELAMFDDAAVTDVARSLGWDAVTDGGRTWFVINPDVLAPATGRHADQWRGTGSAYSGFAPTGSDLRNAAQGGVIGAASEATSDEELTPEQRLARITMGAALGVGAGRRMRGQGAQAGRRLGSGVVPEPDDLTMSMRGRVVPPEVADTLDFPVRIPDDPRTISAIQRIGGTIDPERGVTFNVTRAQAPNAAGGVATRGSVFYEAVEPGGRSNFVRSYDDPTGVGGSQVIPATPTRFRSPLIVSDAPGSQSGFDRAILILSEGRMPFTANEVDYMVERARRAGPDGSQQRADALREVVRRFGGDPDLVDPLIAIRGADASESQWAIRENILAAHARRNGYDGIVTVERTEAPWSAVEGHPEYQQAKQVEQAASDALKQATKAYQDADAAWEAAHVAARRQHGILFNTDTLPEVAQAKAVWDEAKAARQAAQAAFDDANDAVEAVAHRLTRELPSGRISELADVREARNPTPGAPNPRLIEAEAEKNRTLNAVRRIESDLFSQLSPAERRLLLDEGERAVMKRAPDLTERLTELEQARRAAVAADTNLRNLKGSEPPTIGEPGYTLREDIPRRPDAPEQPPMQFNSMGSGAALGAAGGGLTGEEDGEFDLDRALMGAVIGAVAGPGAARGARRFATPDDALKAAQQAITTPNPRGPTTGLSRMEALRRWIVRQAFDNRVDLNELQREAQQLLGRPLEADEMMSELSRANSSGAAKVMIDERVRPILQGLEGQDRQHLSTLLMLLNNADVATATGNPNRVFSGGLTAADSQDAARALWGSLTPQQQQAIGKAADQIQDVVQHYRDEMVRAGLWTPQLAQDLAQKYPNWLPTKIVDYMSDPATTAGNVRSVSLRDRGLRQYSVDGTERAREDPIASLLRYINESESIIQKNEVFNAFVNLRDRVPGWDQLIKEVPNGTPAAKGTGQRTVTGFVNGERKTFSVPAPMAAAIMMEQGAQVPVLRQLTSLFREFITRTPIFVAGQMPMDAFQFTVRQSASEGGPQNVPRVAAELARGYAEAFRGLFSGEFKGDAARYLREGGAMAGFYERAADAASKTVDDLTRRNMFEVRNARDAQRLAGWLLGGEWVQSVGSRVEMAPRIAAMRMGERRALKAGASAEKAALQGMIEGRDVTLDFQRGGVAAKVMNQIVPFFNVGMQSSATLPRAFRQNPAAFTTTALSLVAAPTIAAELWNRSDEQMSRDYDDVPDYVKDRGIVIMLPGVSGRDERGDRRPNYALIPMRELSPIAILTRDLLRGAMGTSERGVGESARAMLGAASPVQANGVADLVGSLVPPGASTALQLATDRDFFRGSQIATDRADENASALAGGVTQAWNAATGRQDRPSQTDFAIRDMFGGVGQIASSASNAVTGRGKDEQRIQSTPVVGGLINRFVGDAVGGRLNKAQEEDTRVPAGIRKVLDEAGVRNVDIKPVASKWKGAPLTRSEQTRWQQATNRLIGQYIREARGESDWSDRSLRERLVQQAVTRAKNEAADQIFTFDPQERIEREEVRKRRRAG